MSFQNAESADWYLRGHRNVSNQVNKLESCYSLPNSESGIIAFGKDGQNIIPHPKKHRYQQDAPDEVTIRIKG